MGFESIRRLHTALVDTRGAYELAVKDTEDAESRENLSRDDFAASCRPSRASSIADLAGETPDENGSFMAVLQETVISVRAIVSGISKKTLPTFASGEEDIVKLYDEAFAESASDRGMSEVLSKQRENLVSKIAETLDRGNSSPARASFHGTLCHEQRDNISE